MMLDVCSPVKDITKKQVADQMKKTHDWAKIAYEYHQSKYENHK